MNDKLTEQSRQLFDLVIEAFKTSPGGIIESDIRPMMDACGFNRATGIKRTMSGLLIGLPVWDEVDEEGDRWWHLAYEGSK